LKTRILIYFTLIGMSLAYKSNGAIAFSYAPNGAANHINIFPARPSLEKISHLLNPSHLVNTLCELRTNNSLRRFKPELLDSVTKILRLQLYLDQYNYDEIVIGFNSGAKTIYDFNEDSRYLPGINAPEGLSSFSSDGVALSINLVPLPGQTSEVIKLNIEAQRSGPFTFKRKQFDSIPEAYHIWLKDNYTKDSVNLRIDSSYAFNIDKTDTASLGANRFCVIISKDQAPAFKLLAFNAAKTSNGAQITWDTQNEQNYTTFSVERSSDGGSVFNTLNCLKSTGAGNYNFTDSNPPAASDGYRLKITDLGGAITFSNTITLMYGNTTNTISGNISIYPNPASTLINLTIDQPAANSSLNSFTTQSIGTAPLLTANTGNAALYNIKIVSISGMVIKTATSATTTWQNNVGSLLPGTYIITVFNNTDRKLVGRRTFIKL